MGDYYLLLLLSPRYEENLVPVYSWTEAAPFAESQALSAPSSGVALGYEECERQTALGTEKKAGRLGSCFLP